MLENQEYRNAEMTLQQGETLLLYTDGFPEARTSSGEFYGAARIKSLLQRQASNSVANLCESAIREIRAFQEDNLSDDITILALRRITGNSPSLFTDILKSRT
jgi:sigma-B regulation protein RsbU (phosphoserine phosphatase)